MSTACSACGAADQPAGARFCSQCGTPLQASCRECSSPLPPGARFCGQCGTPAVEGLARPGGPPPGPGTTSSGGDRGATTTGGGTASGALGGAVAERRVTSVLFCDLVGFTTLSESRDHEETRELLTQYFDDARRIIGRYGGTVEKFIGDAVMAVWGVPTAHEDDAERAVRAGLELVTRVGGHGPRPRGRRPRRPRRGRHRRGRRHASGRCNQGMVAGDAVNTASRVQSVAGPGQVWVDETTRLLTSGAITYVDAGSHLLKGKADPVPLWSARAVVAARGGAQRADGLEAPLVGRERELRLVKEVFHGVEADGRPALLLVDGEAGAGKTRLGWEFEKYVDGLETSVRWHSGRCLAYGEGVAFFAVADAVRGRIAASAGDPDADPATQLAAYFDRYHVPQDEREWLTPRLEVLLGTTSTRLPKEDLFAAWTTFFERVGEGTSPVVLVIDDAQHAEDGLLEFVEHLMTWASFPLFVLLMTRPGLLERRVSLATHRGSTVIHLSALEDSTMAALLDGLVSGLPERTRSGLVRRADGIPLYAVETVRSLIDRDLVVPRGGVYVLASTDPLDLARIGAPASLQALVAARLDALTPGQRHIVNVASVLGTSLSRERIAELCADVSDVDEVLRQLVHLQVLEHQSSRLSSDYGRYGFRQAVVRQVAYTTLSLRDRKRIHLEVIGSYGPAREAPPDQAAVLAQHHLDAIDALPGDDDVPELRRAAVELLVAAADRSRALGVNDDAASHLRAALVQVGDDPEAGARLKALLASVLLDEGLWDDAARLAREATETFDALGDDRAAGSAAATWGAALGFGGDLAGGRDVVLSRWDRLRDDPSATRAALALSRALVHTCPPGQIDDVARDSLALRARLAEKVNDPGELADTFLWTGIDHLFTGATTLGLTLVEAAARIARENQLPSRSTRALINLTANAIGEDAREAVAYGRETVTAARRGGNAAQVWYGQINLVLALWVRGELERPGDDAPHRAPGGSRASGSTSSSPLHGLLLAAATGRAVPLLDEDQDHDIPELHWTDRAWRQWLGALRLAREGRPAEALRDAVRAVELFGTVYDDFHHLWATAARLAQEVGDVGAEERLFAVVDSVNAVVPLALRAHRARFSAAAARRDAGTDVLGRTPEAAAPEVERLLREAVELYATWGALPYEALCSRRAGRMAGAAGSQRRGRTVPRRLARAAARGRGRGLAQRPRAVPRHRGVTSGRHSRASHVGRMPPFLLIGWAVRRRCRSPACTTS